RRAVGACEVTDTEATDGQLAVHASGRGGPDLGVEGVEVLGRQWRVLLRQDLRVTGSGRVRVAAHDGLSTGLSSVLWRRTPRLLSTNPVGERGLGRGTTESSASPTALWARTRRGGRAPYAGPWQRRRVAPGPRRPPPPARRHGDTSATHRRHWPVPPGI